MESIYDEIAKKRFKLPGLYPYQRHLIDEIVRAADSDQEAPPHGLVILPTGAGKSLIYMIPALILEGLTLIIYPLNALINDQLRRFSDAGIRCAALSGGQSLIERRRILAAAGEGALKVLLTNPETLILDQIMEILSTITLGHIVFDEAHTLVEWGESFRPAYCKAAEAVHTLAYRRLTGFTATATPELLQSIGERLFCGESYELYRRSPARDNIAFELVPSLAPEADLKSQICAGRIEYPAILFCPTRRLTESSSALIRSLDPRLSVDYYHAGLPRERKKEIEKDFYRGGRRLLCATCAFGLGVDCAGVRTVLHLSPPPSVEAYIQESGRAGRDGEAARAIMILSPAQVEHAEKYPRQRELIRASVSALSGGTCRREALLSLFTVEGESASDQSGRCGICDCCRERCVELPLGIEEIISSVKQFSGCFSRRGLAAFLKGYASPGVKRVGAEASRRYGALEGWRFEWIEEALLSTIQLGLIRERGLIPPRRLGVTRRGRRLYRHIVRPPRL